MDGITITRESGAYRFKPNKQAREHGYTEALIVESDLENADSLEEAVEVYKQDQPQTDGQEPAADATEPTPEASDE